MSDSTFFDKTRRAFELLSEQIDEFLPELLTLQEGLSTTSDVARQQELITTSSEELEKKFHRLKGGAGFLKLLDVEQAADEAETLFGNCSEAGFDLANLSKKLNETIDTLKRGQESLKKRLSE